MPDPEADRAHMAAALSVARRGLGNLLAEPGGRLRPGQGRPGGRPRLDPARRPPACRDRGAGPGRRPSPRRDGLCHARALLALGPHPALLRRADPGGGRAGGGGDRRPRPAGGRARAAAAGDAGVIVELGLGGAKARAINAGFARRITRGLPLVTLKLATTLDGRIATAGGGPSGSPGRRRGGRRMRSAPGTTRSWSAAARCWPTTRN